MTNPRILSLHVLANHSIVMGGSRIGLEFAQMLRPFGAQLAPDAGCFERLSKSAAT
jgi:pyruvate/2-oxoglutarate dehydrogenase complex dihydrolipoamide dehydrogenase (E3) component